MKKKIASDVVLNKIPLFFDRSLIVIINDYLEDKVSEARRGVLYNCLNSIVRENWSVPYVRDNKGRFLQELCRLLFDKQGYDAFVCPITQESEPVQYFLQKKNRENYTFLVSDIDGIHFDLFQKKSLCTWLSRSNKHPLHYHEVERDQCFVEGGFLNPFLLEVTLIKGKRMSQLLLSSEGHPHGNTVDSLAGTDRSISPYFIRHVRGPSLTNKVLFYN